MVPDDCCFYVYCVNVHFHRNKKFKSELWQSQVDFDNRLFAKVKTDDMLYVAV